MNGQEIVERVTETFRYELGLAINPLTKSVDNLGNVLVEHGEDIVENKTEIGHLKNGVKTASHRLWAIIIGVPALMLIVVGVISYL